MMNETKKWGVRCVQGLVIGMLLAVAMSPAKGQPQPQAQAATAKRAFETRDWYRVKTVASPSMSPDGKYVAVQVTSVLEAANKRVNEIWVVSTAPGGGDPVRFTAPGVDSTNPRFMLRRNAADFQLDTSRLPRHPVGDPDGSSGRGVPLHGRECGPGR